MHLPPVLDRFGIRTLGELSALPRAALADRFGTAGPLAHDLACGRDAPLRPRGALERLEESLELPESGSGEQLERALGLLIDRLLARRERRGRTLRAVVVSARLVEGGTWHERLTFREALADPHRMRLALVPRLATLPAPADVLRLRAEGFGPPAGEQRSLLAEPAAVRGARLREAVRQARAVAGPDAALRVLEVDPDSRVPERRLVLTPWDP
jgi:protein ImuB